MNRFIKLVITCTSILAGCGVDDDPDALNTKQQDVLALTSPAITRNGTSSASILPSSARGPGRGPGLELRGGSELGSYLLATYRVPAGSNDATAAFTVTPASGAAFVYMLLGSGSRYATQQLRLQRTPGSNQLQAAAVTGTVTCGTVASGTPTAVALVFDSASRTFDVLINGATSACMDLPTRIQPPIVGFGLMDASNEGYGGRVDFTDLAVF
jgi:hypothetical protein